jgi:hypothetical protein
LRRPFGCHDRPQLAQQRPGAYRFDHRHRPIIAQSLRPHDARQMRADLRISLFEDSGELRQNAY